MPVEPSLSSLKPLVAEPYNPAVAEDGGTAEIIADAVVDHGADEAAQSGDRHDGPELESALIDEISSERQDHLAWDGKSGALHDHQDENSGIAELGERVD